MGVSINAAKEVFKASATTLLCIYMFTLNTARELRKLTNIDDNYSDDMIICKYGHTADLERRIVDRNKNYGSIKNVLLKFYGYVNPIYIPNRS